MSEKHDKHIPTTSEIADAVVEKLQPKQPQQQPQLSLGIQQITNNREGTWDKILKYALLPATPLIFISMVGFFINAYVNINTTLIRIEARLDGIEKQLSSTEIKLNDHENRLRDLERRK